MKLPPQNSGGLLARSGGLKERRTKASSNDVVWTCLYFFVNSTDVFADQSQEDKNETRKKSNQNCESSKSTRGLVQEKLCINGVGGEDQRSQDPESSEDSRRA